MHQVALNKAGKGAYIMRKADSKTVYQVAGYDRSSKRWELVDTEDICKVLYLRSSTLV